MRIRINKYLASCGIGSRRSVEKLIAENRVTLRGERVTELATKVDPAEDTVRVDGRIVRPVGKKIYVLLNKPKGYLSTVSDERGRRTVIDLVKIDERLYPVGRLDANSEGLLLLTNDGDIANRLIHPKYHVRKTYRVKLDKVFRQEDFVPLTTGIQLSDGLTAPCKAFFYTEELDRLEIQIREGRNRQIRRMFEALDYRVKTLRRIRFGPLSLEGVARGQWRYLTRREINSLTKMI